ncbi:hypothetical protein NHX12_028453 [Muraenolepis orangiensis]|uniref:Uncharacterized protein n=1 Tax=Muraenolepis orangiensis TaxID=630683 RepID=A0A9Q0E9H7_9TELE|nr:hypothetical protein NHX12_028453 [Muraenolepis orangiensis]
MNGWTKDFTRLGAFCVTRGREQREMSPSTLASSTTTSPGPSVDPTTSPGPSVDPTTSPGLQWTPPHPPGLQWTPPHPRAFSGPHHTPRAFSGPHHTPGPSVDPLLQAAVNHTVGLPFRGGLGADQDHAVSNLRVSTAEGALQAAEEAVVGHLSGLSPAPSPPFLYEAPGSHMPDDLIPE